MPNKTRVVAPGPDKRTVRTDDGQILKAPNDWTLLAPGDAARFGACVHAVAGDHAAAAGERGLVAGDLMPHLRTLVN